MIPIKNILFATDFSESSAHALKYAISFAREFGAKLWVLHVVEEITQTVPFDMIQAPPLADFQADMVRRAREAVTKVVPEEMRGEVQWEGMVRQGVPFYEIVRVAAEIKADLIVCGTHGLTGLKHMIFGSVAEKVVRKAPCPVLSVRHPEQRFEWPHAEAPSQEKPNG
jgi:nucleotide-binding universal stress UspA family protein